MYNAQHDPYSPGYQINSVDEVSRVYNLYVKPYLLDALGKQAEDWECM